MEKGPDGFLASDWKAAVRKAWCKACRCKKVRVGYYAKHHRKVSQRYQERRQALAAIKSERGCLECGEQHPACLDFHHREGRKHPHSVGTMVSRGATLERLLVEIEECDVLCSNCHRKHHYQHGYPRSRKRSATVIPITSKQQSA